MSYKFETNIQDIKEKKIAIWGTGQLMNQYIHKIMPALNVVCFCNTYHAGECVNGLPCIYPEDLKKSVEAVVIAIKSEKSVLEVKEQLEKMEIPYCHIIEAVWGCMPEWDISEIAKANDCETVDYDPKKIVRYVNFFVPYKNCNLRCEYCYVGQHRSFIEEKKHFHMPEFIRAALSKKRMGGVCLFNFCAGGETMMCQELFPILAEIYKEGHYIMIGTNGTITKNFDNMIKLFGSLDRVFFKFSFHYLELKKRNMLDVYFRNIQKVKSAGASYTLELVPSDNLIPYIEEIKQVSLENAGAVPHLTVPRDDTEKQLKVLTELPLEKFQEIWSVFDSAMFDFKMATVNERRFEDCRAGEWSLWVNLETGITKKCVGNQYLCNIYDDIKASIPWEKIGNQCALPYCFNCHAYLTLGLIKEIEAPTYCEVRDRVTTNGDHWLTEEMQEVFKQRLYRNNEE